MHDLYIATIFKTFEGLIPIRPDERLAHYKSDEYVGKFEVLRYFSANEPPNRNAYQPLHNVSVKSIPFNTKKLQYIFFN